MAADWENILKYKEKIYHICSNERRRREKEAARRQEGGEKTSKSFPLSVRAGVYFFSSFLFFYNFQSTAPLSLLFYNKNNIFFFSFLISFLPCFDRVVAAGLRPPAS
jgi:hypothetical protein